MGAAHEGKTMKVKFSRRVVYETEGRGIGQVYEAGSVHDLRTDMANRWIRRGIAEEVGNPVEPVEEAAVAEDAPKEEKPRAERLQLRTK
jgi:hypothetical protein